MATLQKIRNRGPVIAIVIGIALLAFLLGDFLSSGQAFFADDNNIAEINGNSVSIQEYQVRYNNYEEGFKLLTGQTNINQEQVDYIKSQVWDKIVKNFALSDTYDDLGIDVSSQELAKIISGENIQTGLDPLTRQVFSDPATGIFNSQAAIGFFTNSSQSQETMQIATFLENEMNDNRKFTKYSALISKGINVTEFEAKKLYKERTEFVDFEYTVKKYTEISDSSITVSDKEIKEYYEEHKEEYEQEDSRDIAYIVIETIPSDIDKDVAKQDLDYYKKEFTEFNTDSTQDEIINWVNANSQTPFTYAHLTLEELGDTALFYLDKDSVIGPIFENGNYVLKRVIDRVLLPDSAEVRHILINPDGQVIKDMNRANAIADSLFTLINNGGDFAELAKTHSSDQRSGQNGGDLGMIAEGQMIREFSDACFYGKVGDIVKVEASYGVHIIEITGQSKEKKEKVRLAVITNVVQPGNNTVSEFYAKARDFSVNSGNNMDKFDQLIEEGGYTKRIATDITHETKVIAGLENPGQVINWTYKSEVEKFSVSEPFSEGNLFVIAIITEIREKGIAPIEQVKDYIYTKMIKQKKGEMLANEMKNISSFDKNAKNISFASARLNDDGIEYSVIATASVIGKDVISAPVIGENGVYVLKVTSKTGLENLENIDVTNDKNNAQMRLLFRVTNGSFEALKESSDVVDNRYKYF